MPNGLQGPVTVRVRMYQVGFGDCFLLSFEYDHEVEPGRRDRQVLMDFGSMSLARGARTLGPTAKRILEHCGGNLDAVIVSHRHRDHLSGFGAEGAGSLLPTPTLVVRSWTEDPELPANAEAPMGGGPGADSVAFQATLGTAHASSYASV